MWAIGLEVLLLVDDPWKTIMTTDHPNGGIFTQYPQVITWLMSKKARDDTAKECHKWAYEKSSLGGVDREMSLYEIAILTRANSARTIGMAYRKGHLGLGADGDVTVYDLDPTNLDLNDPKNLISTALPAGLYDKGRPDCGPAGRGCGGARRPQILLPALCR